ncbi:MAG: adenosylcobinamide-GDP ribazoletransferase, partial [Myxococcales bacterium]|nr:adenosylcobinamide-GDP ribazoletransferase [Myxococcales bacterium]
QAGRVQGVVALGWLIAAAAVATRMGAVSPARAVALHLVLTGVTAITGWRYVERAGGITGDFLGATEQLGELAGYAVLAWA